jgi:ABC-2 type transport system permease protein
MSFRDRVQQAGGGIREYLHEPAAIMKKELMTYFYTPIAYIVIMVFLIVMGILFFYFPNFFYVNQAEMRVFFEWLPAILIFFVPAVTMRLFAEEIHTGTIESLMTLPVTTSKVVIGKFLAAVLFLIIMMSPSLVYLASILFVGSPDPGPVIGGYIGSILLAGCYASLGVLSSSISRNQVVAFILGLLFCGFLWIIGKLVWFVPTKIVFLEYLGTDYHFRNISKGIIDSRDIIYFLSIIVISILVTTKILDDRR